MAPSSLFPCLIQEFIQVIRLPMGLMRRVASRFAVLVAGVIVLATATRKALLKPLFVAQVVHGLFVAFRNLGFKAMLPRALLSGFLMLEAVEMWTTG